MDRLEAMAMLVTVSELGSFSAASRSLEVPLATLSRKVSDLEKILGTRLLIRTTRKLTLTDAGHSYVIAARKILEQVEEAESVAAGEYQVPKGELIISAPIMFGRKHVLPVLTAFLDEFPEITARLQLTDSNVDLIESHVDMAIRIGNLPDSTMVATQVGQMRTVTCASPQLLARHGTPQQPSDLTAIPCVTVDIPMPSSGWRYHNPRLDNEQIIAVHPRLSISTPEAAACAAVQGIGITRLLHYQVIDAVTSGELAIVLEQFEPPPAPINLLHASRGLMPLKMRRFLDFAVPKYRANLSVFAC